MKRLLTTTAAIGLMVAAATATAIPVPALASHDTWTILQDFDIINGVAGNPMDQNVINEINGVNVGDDQAGSNLANSFTIVDPNDEAGAVGDSYDIDQLFDENQTVTNTVNATGQVTANQSGTNVANLGSITDAFGGTTDGDVYSIEQLASSVAGAEAGSQKVTNTIGGGAISISDSSQTGTDQVNALTITDSAGGVSTAGTLTISQQVATANNFDQYVNNAATAGTIDGLSQEGATKANLLTLGLANQNGGVSVNVTQNTTDVFDQSVMNTITGSASVVNVSQSGSNVANVITVPTN